MGVIGKLVIWHLQRVLIAAAILFAVFMLIRIFGLLSRGNRARYSPQKEKKLPENLLTGKTIFFLGSSVTKGMAAKGQSFVEFIAARNGCSCVKSAVSGTTLAGAGSRSYVNRLHQMDKTARCDLFVCQLSTNDATRKIPLGTLSSGFDADFDTSTVYGALEHIIAYAKKTWNCPVVFYTNPQYASARYREMVIALKEVAKKWDSSVIDLWDNEEINRDFNKKPFMNDKIHPTMCGYQRWTPVFEDAFAKVLAGGTLPVGSVAPVPRRSSREKTRLKLRIAAGTLIAVLLISASTSIYMSITMLGILRRGNSSRYDPQNVETVQDSPLIGKRILNLGSSVAIGTGSRGITYADFLEVRDGCIVTTEAQMATTLSLRPGKEGTSYVERLQANVDPQQTFDLVLVQISSNDATSGQDIGVPTDSFEQSSFDPSTVCGAVEYIISYCQETWNCPVVFYTGTYFEAGLVYQPGNYTDMVAMMHQVVEKWSEHGSKVSLIDQWNDPAMLAVSDTDYELYMCDGVHPTKAGYLLWWLPNFERELYTYFE